MTVERIIGIAPSLITVIGIGIAIGIFQARLDERGKDIDQLLKMVAPIGSLKTQIVIMEKRLGRIEAGMMRLKPRQHPFSSAQADE